MAPLRVPSPLAGSVPSTLAEVAEPYLAEVAEPLSSASTNRGEPADPPPDSVPNLPGEDSCHFTGSAAALGFEGLTGVFFRGGDIGDPLFEFDDLGAMPSGFGERIITVFLDTSQSRPGSLPNIVEGLCVLSSGMGEIAIGPSEGASLLSRDLLGFGDGSDVELLGTDVLRGAQRRAGKAVPRGAQGRVGKPVPYRTQRRAGEAVPCCAHGCLGSAGQRRRRVGPRTQRVADAGEILRSDRRKPGTGVGEVGLQLGTVRVRLLEP